MNINSINLFNSQHSAKIPAFNGEFKLIQDYNYTDTKNKARHDIIYTYTPFKGEKEEEIRKTVDTFVKKEENNGTHDNLITRVLCFPEKPLSFTENDAEFLKNLITNAINDVLNKKDI